MIALAIDPGDVHVGWAMWTEENKRVEGGEVEAKNAIALVERSLGLAQSSRINAVLVLEEFKLYPDKAKEQAGSPMLTAQMIGAMRYVARLCDAEVVLQGANIKKATSKQLKARGIDKLSTGPHAKDAQLHLFHYLLKEGLWKTISPSS